MRGARGVHGRELHVVGVGAGARHHSARGLQRLLARLAELVLQVDVAGGHEDVNARTCRNAHGLPGAIHVDVDRARQPTDHRPLDLLGDAPDGGEVVRRGHGEAGLDDIHAEPRELARDLELLVGVECGARGLLAVTQSGVKDAQVVHGSLRSRLSAIRY